MIAAAPGAVHGARMAATGGSSLGSAAVDTKMT